MITQIILTTSSNKYFPKISKSAYGLFPWISNSEGGFFYFSKNYAQLDYRERSKSNMRVITCY